MSRHTQLTGQIPGYTYGSDTVSPSPITVADLERLKQALGWTQEDEHYRRLAGDVLVDQTEALVTHWRSILSAQPHLARYSLSLAGEPIPHYSQDSGLRFQQWVLDTCFRPYDQDWLNYQQEIALRHTSVKKNRTDGVQSALSIPLRYVLGFAPVLIESTKPFLAKQGHPDAEVDKMYRAWSKSVLLQITLWSYPYTSTTLAPNEW